MARLASSSRLGLSQARNEGNAGNEDALSAAPTCPLGVTVISPLFAGFQSGGLQVLKKIPIWNNPPPRYTRIPFTEIAITSRRTICFGLGLLPLTARAGLYDDYINSTSKQPFVSFLGRKGSLSTVGHAFVGVGVQLDATLRVYERFFGLYPNGNALGALKSVLSPVSGRLDVSWADTVWDTEFIHSIDDDQHLNVLAKFDEWRSSAPKYSLLENGGMNCNGLVSEVAGIVGLQVPRGPGTTRPWVFIDALRKSN